MTRVKRGVAAHKRRKYVLARTKGFTNRRRTNAIAAKEALLHAGKNAFIIGGGYLAAVAIGTVAFPPLAAFYLAGAVAGTYLAGWGVGRLFRKS